MTLTIDTENGFAAVDGVESVRQRVLQTLHFSRGQWFMNLAAGTPYLTSIFGRSAVPLAEQQLRSRIEALDGVDAVTEIRSEIDEDTRTLTIYITVQTEGASLQVRSSF